MKIVADAHIPFVKEYFSAQGDLILKPGRTITREDLREADILLVRSITPVNKNLLDQTQVKFVGSVTAGQDHLDTAWLDKAGIAWTVAAGFNAPPVADYVVSVIAALQKKKLLVSPTLKAAVIGVGNVGRLVAERLRLLNFDVVMCDPLRAEKEKGFDSISIDALSDLDLITLHAPLTKSGAHPTYHLMSPAILERLPPKCTLINTSRGAVIDSQALLQQGAHLRWCFDVWEHEPTINQLILEKAYIGTPHIAGYSVQSKIRGIDMIYKIGCARGFIQSQSKSPINMPHQQFTFSTDQLGWQDIILDIFNPLVMTEKMRSTLLSTPDSGLLFDEMRNQFNFRTEFSFADIKINNLSNEDNDILLKLGVKRVK